MVMTVDTRSSGGARIARATLHEELLGRLRDMIIEGELAPGARVPERILCEHFGISRTPLREALKVLAMEGLIELAPNRGAIVAPFTIQQVSEVFPVMGALEALSGELACANITEDELAEIRAVHYQMILHYRNGALSDYFHLNQRIHELILEAARNPTLASTYHSLASRTRRARFMANMSKERWAHAVAEHEQILKALEDRDGPRLKELLVQHLKSKHQTIKESLLAEEAAGKGT